MQASERRLLLILGVLAAVCGGAVLTQRTLLRQHAVERREQVLDLKRLEAQSLLADAGLWQQRLEWLQTAQPGMTSANQASEELLEALLESAATHGVQVQKRQLHEVVLKASCQEVGATLTVNGTLTAVFRWLHAALAPESFCAVPELKVVPDSADASKVTATIHFSRLYSPVTAAPASLEVDKS
jgi:hypothetical protein